MNTQDWSPSGWTGWTSLQSKGLSRVFSNTTVQKHQFFSTQLSLWSNSHIHTWRQSRGTWSNRQICPWSPEWSGAKADRALPRERTGHSKHPLPKHRDNPTHGHHQIGQHWNQTDFILCNQRWRSPTQSAKTRLGGDWGSDHELLIAKFRLKLKKVEKTTRPFRYDRNQIPYNYIVVEVTNRFKG